MTPLKRVIALLAIVSIALVWTLLPEGGTRSDILSRQVIPESQVGGPDRSSPDAEKPLSVRECLAEFKVDHEDDASHMNNVAGSCPHTPTGATLAEFTLDGKISVEEWYQCQTGPDYQKRHHYSQAWVDENVDYVRRKKKIYYGRTDTFFYSALERYPWKGKDVVVMGSQRPIYESFCIVYNASTCTTIDFQVVTSDDPRLSFKTIAQYDEDPVRFDAAISISSFEHDGLGRYGDPMRPNGDLEMMKKMRCILKPGGLLYLSVPIAKDKIVWNMHRVYGRVRLPLLLQYWTLKGVYADGYMFDRWTGCDARGEGDYQPIFVLENTLPKPGANEKMLDQFLLDNPPAKDGEYSCFQSAYGNTFRRPTEEAIAKATKMFDLPLVD